MREKIKQIARRVGELRCLLDISPGDMCSRLGIDEQTYQSYEAGEKDMPASILLAIADELGVDSSVLLTGKEAKMHLFSVTRKGKGVQIDRRKQYDYEALATEFLHKKADPFIVTVRPDAGEEQINPAAHAGQEFNYVLKGNVRLMIHDNEIHLSEGDSIYFDSSCPHSMQAMNGREAVFLAIVM
ncbi:hypothetical protein L21SP3_00654 [Sedimentisphaera cyanobacteriorum]|uniref:HTH cro/C1-type domain-containing protein n=1 Tax=Sedimentisphaera cyanobacteriorum TaxID=1940790 RepID=A0A1Q2HNF4_9BACT|nr:XRE family transcriptional regulator [Sedimentisphaera cyanobacteriorum]AQQ08861.1 hypothetical protein L21SP3_00654 [Sedimentisphaera cyanobacteriorum]